MAVLVYSQAQQRGGRMNPEERAKRTVETLEQSLKLTAPQKDSVYAYSLEQAKEQQALFQQAGDGGRAGIMEKMRVIREKTDTKIKAVLDETQKKQYDEQMKERQGRGGFGGGGGRQN